MVNRPKSIGTRAETAVARWLNAHGFDGAERIALHGVADEGDVSLCPGVMAEVKGGKAAETASNAQVAAWLGDTERERVARGADVALLVLKRAGKGAANAGAWWVSLPGWAFVYLAQSANGAAGAFNVNAFRAHYAPVPAVRITLDDAAYLLRRAGYGTPLQRGLSA